MIKSVFGLFVLASKNVFFNCISKNNFCDNLIKNSKSYFKFIFFLEFKRVITTRNSARKLEDEP
jgi:hypothetical protein